MRLTLLILWVAGCAHTASVTSDVPIAFGRWRPPQGQSCYVDAIQPPELPAVSTLLDSAAVATELRAYVPGDVLIALAFDSSGRTERLQVIDRRMSAAAADSVREVIASHLRAPRSKQVWGGRMRVSTGAPAALALGRRELCPPALARIEPRRLRIDTASVAEPELVPSPDWIIRGDHPPPGPARSSVDKILAGKPVRDTARLTIDSATISPDLAALGADALTMRVLIDTAGTIAHAEISRAAAAGINRRRLVAELTRYRFHPALEDRVRTPWWVILRIR